jgi:hypothetical protein
MKGMRRAISLAKLYCYNYALLSSFVHYKQNVLQIRSRNVIYIDILMTD